MNVTPDSNATDEAVLRADSGLRRQVILFFVVFVVLGSGVILGLEHHLEGIMEASQENPEKATREIFGLLRLSMIAGGVGLIIFALYLGRYSMKVLAQDRFPPSGAKVIRDTPILRGSPARLRGRAGLIFSALLLVCGLGVPWVPDLVIRPFMTEFLKEPPTVGDEPAEISPTSETRPELHAGTADPSQPGRTETGPSPRASSRFLTA